MKCHFFFAIIWLLPLYGVGQTLNLNGKVLSHENRDGVPYVSIGIKDSPYGTVADSVGIFRLVYDGKVITESDSVIFTTIGHKRTAKTIRELYSDNQVVLCPDSNFLSTVKISVKAPILKTYGKNSSRIIVSPSLYKSIPKESDELGREQATILKIDKDVLLHELSLSSLGTKNVERLKFRINIYDVKNHMPNKRIIEKDISFDVYPDRMPRIGMPKPRIIDLKPFGIRIKGYKEIAIGIELLDVNYIQKDTLKTVFFVSSSPNL